MLIMLLLFPLLVAASDDMASEKYCFSSGTEAGLAKRKFSAIQIPSDTATLDNSCLVIQMRPHRRELIQRYVLSSVNGGSVVFSSADIRRKPCKLKVEKIRQIQKKNLSIGLMDQQLGASQAETTGSGHEVMKIDTLNEFKLTVDQDEIVGSCKFITADRYEISLEVRKNPKPIIPGELPSGTIVVVTTPPPDQKTMLLKTELQLNRGERIEIGDLIQKIEDKNHLVNIRPSLKIENKQQNTSTKVFLSLQ